MFRIVMNDGWTEVMYTAMDRVYEFGGVFICLTALFFIFFHLLTNSVSVCRRARGGGSGMSEKCVCVWNASFHRLLFIGVHLDVSSVDAERMG